MCPSLCIIAALYLPCQLMSMQTLLEAALLGMQMTSYIASTDKGWTMNMQSVVLCSRGNATMFIEKISISCRSMTQEANLAMRNRMAISRPGTQPAFKSRIVWTILLASCRLSSGHAACQQSAAVSILQGYCSYDSYIQNSNVDPQGRRPAKVLLPGWHASRDVFVSAFGVAAKPISI